MVNKFINQSGTFPSPGRGQGRFIHCYLKLTLLSILILLISGTASSQVRVRLFANQNTISATFTVTAGKYELNVYDDKPIKLVKNDVLVLALLKGKVAVKVKDQLSFLCDSAVARGMTGKDSFSVRIAGTASPRQNFTGDLQCFPDMGKLVLVNSCDIEEYVAGVVKAEAGPGKNIEYLKSQALLVRSYMYKYFNRHVLDRYNLCDNTHCQAFYGITTDTMIIRAALETHGLVVLAQDSTLINSAFHSNCGGETTLSENVWLAGYPYLKKVNDPYCTSSRNAKWTMTIPFQEWKDYLRRSGYMEGSSNPADYNFSQLTRLPEYIIGSFALPFTKIRTDLNLRSSFFSVIADESKVELRGRGYGHGVGLCQEGAMAMAAKGFNFREIIDFYFSDVIITDIRNAKKEINIF